MDSFYTTLDHQDLLEVSGEDSEKFLQGQLTCNLDEMLPGQCITGAACNNKGRVFSSFRVLRLDQSYYLVMQGGMITTAMLELKKYIPFYKAAMTDSSAKYNRTGLAGPEAERLLRRIFPDLPDQGHYIHNNGNILLNISDRLPRYEWWVVHDGESPQIDLPLEAPAHWDLLDLEAGLFFIRSEDIGLYTPEELNLDLAGFVNFDKGCYTGQEIVARMHYRGKAKKRMFSISLESPAELTERALTDSSDNTVGIATNLLYLKNNKVRGFAILKADTSPGETLWLVHDSEKIQVVVNPVQA